MKPTNKKLSLEKIEELARLGWIALSDWIFFKSGKIYDLSAANLEQLERIEKESLFVIAE